MIRPHSPTDNPEFMEGWDKLQAENTLKMMQYLLDFERSQIDKLTKQLKVEKLISSNLKITQFEEKLQKQVKQHKESRKIKKIRKFVRDSQDFTHGRVCNWSRKQVTTTPQPSNHSATGSTGVRKFRDRGRE